MSGWPIGGTQRFASIAHNASTSNGTTLTANATANTKAATWTELTASTAFKCDLLWVFIKPGTAHVGYLVDIAVGAGGSEQVIVPNLLINSRINQTSVYGFPLSIPVGTRVAARCQASTGSSTCTIKLQIGSGTWGLPQAFTRVVDLGTVTSGASRGTDIDPGATANTKPSTYTTLATTGASDYVRGVVMAVTGGGNAALSAASWLMDLAFGAASSESVVIPDINFASDLTSDEIMPSTYPYVPLQIPPSTRVSARAQCSITDASDRHFDLAVYGVC